MSICIEDYIPFDYIRYAFEILPALEQATRGNTIPLSELIASATHFSPRLRAKYPLPLPKEESDDLIELFAGLFDVPTLHRIRAGESRNPWDALATVVPTLEGKSLARLGDFGEMLKYHLLATFCCEVPPWSGNWPNLYSGFLSNESYIGPILWHDEIVFDWHEYCQRDEETQALWEAYRKPLHPDLMQMLHINDESSSTVYQYGPRSLSILSETERELGIPGFMTLEEIQHLLEHVRTHESPLLNSIIVECVRDGENRYWAIDIEALDKDAVKDEEVIGEEGWFYFRRQDLYISNRAVFKQWMNVPHYQAEMELYHLRRFYEKLHVVEDEILHRMRFAAERGWGILVMEGKL